MALSDDGSVDDEGELVSALQGRILALERLVLALLLDMVSRDTRSSSYEDAAQIISKVILSSAQHAQFQNNLTSDMVWESCGMALRNMLKNLVEKAKVLDG